MKTIHDCRRTPGFARRPGGPGPRPAGRGARLLLAAGLLAGSVTVATAGPAAADTPPTQTFDSFGTYQVTVPAYATSMKLAGLGGAGIGGQASADGSSAGGAPGSGTNVTETLPIGADYHAGDVLSITVGRHGGGGAGGTGDGIAGDGGSGGAASSVFDENTGVYLMVAAGGGGGGGGSGLFVGFDGGSGGTNGDGASGIPSFPGGAGGAKGDNCAGDGTVGTGGQGDSAGTASADGGGGGGGGGTCAGHSGKSGGGGGGGGGGSGNSTTDPSATAHSSAPGTNTEDGSVTVTFPQDLQAPALTPPGCQYAPSLATGFYGKVSATGVPAPTLALVNAPVWLTLGEESTTWTGSTYLVSAWIVYTPTAPAVPGEYTFPVEAFNSQGSIFDPITLVAEDGITQPTFLSVPAATATAGTPFSFQATAVGCPAPDTYSISDADPGTSSWLSIDPATGLLSGTPAAADIGTHTFTIGASSSNGSEFTQAFSLRVSATSPAPPTAPAIIETVPFDRYAAVRFTPPVDDGGAPVLSYTVTATDHTTPANGGQTATVAAPAGLTDISALVTGLTNGDHYTLAVTATNKAGTGDASAPSNDVVPFTFPSVPSISSVTPGPGQATVNFNPPSRQTAGCRSPAIR